MKVKGDDLVIMWQQDGRWQTLAYGTTCELDVQAEMMNVSSPDTGDWNVGKKRKLSWRGSSGHLLCERASVRALWNLLTGKESVRLSMCSVATHKEGEDADNYLPDGRFTMTGDAFITRVTITGRRGDMATLSFSFEGSGELSFE